MTLLSLVCLLSCFVFSSSGVHGLTSVQMVCCHCCSKCWFCFCSLSLSSPSALPLYSHSLKSLISCLHTKSHGRITSGGEKISRAGFWLRTSKQRSPSVSPCLVKSSFPPDSVGTRVTAVGYSNDLLPLRFGLPPCAGFVRSEDEQLRGTAGHRLGGPDLPPWRASPSPSALFTASYERGISLL